MLKEGMKISYKEKCYYIWQIVNEVVFLLNKGCDRPVFIKVELSELATSTKGDIAHVRS